METFIFRFQTEKNTFADAPVNLFFSCRRNAGMCARTLTPKPKTNYMKSPTTKNIVVDEAHELTYVVMAYRVLTDGELFRAIRVEILKRGGKLPAKGESVLINTTIGSDA